MRNLILSAALGLFALPAMAGSIQGTWASDPQHCSGAYPETQVQISGNQIRFIETTCQLTNPTGLRDMPEAQLYDMVCSGEGESWSERAFIGTDQGGLVVYSRGTARTYRSC